MKVAALDLGTNSFLCLIAEVERGEIQQVLSDQVEIVRLGQGVNETKRFHPEALARARACLIRFKNEIDRWMPERVLAMATSAARDVENAEDLLRIGHELKIPLEIIRGDQEAEISFHGSISGWPKDGKQRAVIDIGGGSTEIIVGTHERIVTGTSLNIGALRLTEMHLRQQPPSERELDDLRAHVQDALSRASVLAQAGAVEELVAVAGTPTELAVASLGGFDPKKVDGYQLDLGRLQDWIEKFKRTSPAQRIENFGISPGRADIILAGTLLLKLILEVLKFPSVTVSTRGVRYGVALELEKRG